MWVLREFSAYNSGFPGPTSSSLNHQIWVWQQDDVDWVALTKIYKSISYTTIDDESFPYRFHVFNARLTEQEANRFNQSQ